ncbi:MAG: hypothetical protein IPK82_27875 [Polyangiaceae bacterium]|nr:hypothetical protein [Polyangiaceae bacterium]
MLRSPAAPPRPSAHGFETEPLPTVPAGRPALPFAPPHAPSSAADEDTEVGLAQDGEQTVGLDPHRQRRFVRFDPLTGKPVAQPYWQDLPIPSTPNR